MAQPDLSHAGGISEVLRITTAYETEGVLLAPHCPLRPIALTASIQTDVASPNSLIQHRASAFTPTGIRLLDNLVDRSIFAVIDGCVARLLTLGLGAEID